MFRHERHALEGEATSAATMDQPGLPPKEGSMGRSWGGFLPQNEVVKLQWAAIEASCAGVQAEVFRKLLADHNVDEQEADESLPPWNPEVIDPNNGK